jgi:hypothetical protein
MTDESSALEQDPLTEVEYFNRIQPQREHPYEAGATLLAALAIILGVAALHFGTPFKVGFLAMLLATLALIFSGERDRFARTAMIVAVGGWLVGGILAVLASKAVW